MTEIGIILVPNIAHGGMKITEVNRTGERDDPFGHAVRTADDNFIVPEVKLFDSGWE